MTEGLVERLVAMVRKIENGKLKELEQKREEILRSLGIESSTPDVDSLVHLDKMADSNPPNSVIHYQLLKFKLSHLEISEIPYGIKYFFDDLKGPVLYAVVCSDGEIHSNYFSKT